SAADTGDKLERTAGFRVVGREARRAGTRYNAEDGKPPDWKLHCREAGRQSCRSYGKTQLQGAGGLSRRIADSVRWISCVMKSSRGIRRTARFARSAKRKLRRSFWSTEETVAERIRRAGRFAWCRTVFLR